ncbi:DEAD/DEAH box helicase [Candidatus Acidianus copahuensis]|uniref:DEAD/DEAH box helicase n=1 Tax=Candidatus Acidianus copahuensis TaxID=1160895 RepID=A0A031LRE1_9CREN|nr:ATP-dependent DNA helicase [Candidatus Acidianus copahuensis]EZQ06969.1 DEAD/DEAH box helicase [Candidatus Acidianus copahuensis]
MDLRNWQAKLKDKVKVQLKEGFLVALQAPTGSGKSLFSILVSLEVKDKVLYLVRTQNEIYPAYRETVRLGRRFSFIVGKTTACPLASEDVDPEDINCKYCELFTSTNVYVDQPPFSFLNKLKENGIKEGFCPYYSLFSSMEQAEVIAMTYPYIFIPRLRESLSLDLSQYVLIIDEAHNLDKVNDLDEVRLTHGTIEGAIKQSGNDTVKSYLDKLKSQVSKLVYPDEKYIKIDSPLTLDEDVLELFEEEYESIRDKMVKEKKIRKIYVGSILKFFKKQGQIFSYKGSLVKKEILSSVFTSFLNDEKVSVLLMSGTLQPKEYLEKVLGITRKIYYVDVEKEVRERITGTHDCFIASDVTSAFSRRGKEMWKKYASYLLKIYYQAKENVLSVFPSYSIMEDVMSLLSIPKFVEGERSNIEQVLNLKEKTLIAAVARGKLTEGIEITDKGKSLISDVILAGIPYPSIDDYFKMQADAIKRITKTDITDLVIRTQAVIAVKQAIGRAIRDPSDRVNVWLLDKRYETTWWKGKVNCFNPKKVRL